jgi:hypothetical protein
MTYGVKLKKTDKRYKKFKKQRKKRGWDDSETWNLYTVVGKFLVPRLRRFAKLTFGYPPQLTMEQWVSIVNEIADGFEALDKIDNMYSLEEYKGLSADRLRKEEKKLYKKVEKSLKLFKQYFFNLWW